MTTCYKKRAVGKLPKAVTCVDGPFFPNDELPIKQRMQALRDECYAAMCRRAEEESDEEDTENDDTDSEDKTKKYSYDGKTKLSWPVMGNVILPYSMDTTVYYTTLDHYACNDGLLIGAKVGDEVVAAADGRVVNISDSDRYGTTVTILIGDYYEMEYAQVTDLKCEIGDEVEEGQIIAAVAEPTRAFGLEGPHLFLKMTCKGEAVNPTDYLK